MSVPPWISASTPPLPRSLAREGFSLIEVVLAVGIISFCLVALTGLLAVCFTSSRESVATTSNTLLFQKVVNQLRVGSADYLQRHPGGALPSDIFPLPALGTPDDETTFTVDSLNRYIADGASLAGDSAKVVTVKVMTPSDLSLGNMEAPVMLQRGMNGGKVAFVSVKIKSAQGYQKDVASPLAAPSQFCTEISLLTQ